MALENSLGSDPFSSSQRPDNISQVNATQVFANVRKMRVTVRSLNIRFI